VDLLIRNCGEVVTAVGTARRARRRLGDVARSGRRDPRSRRRHRRRRSRSPKSLPQARAARVELDRRRLHGAAGFVDPHTHAVFGTPRAAEYAARLEGVSYVEIAAAGGGIHQSVREVRAASEDELVRLALPRLRSMLVHGTTTVEIKSGYGLDTANEIKMLRAVRRLAGARSAEIVATFLGAHELPLEFRARRAEYVQQVATRCCPQRRAWPSSTTSSASRASSRSRRAKRSCAPARRTDSRRSCTPTSSSPTAPPSWRAGSGPFRPIT
jgi:imidazolonepropionase